MNAGQTLKLRLVAHTFAAAAGYAVCDIKVKESRAAANLRVPAWDVFVREPGKTHGKCIGAIAGRLLFTGTGAA